MFSTKSIVSRVQTLLLAAGLAAALASPAVAQTEFTYQGVLSDGSGPVTGTESIRFRLYDAPVAGTLFGETTQNVDVADGVFSAPLNLGTLHTIDPESAWIEIAVGIGGGSFDTLGRQKITAAPFAMNTRGLFVDVDNFVGLGDVYLQGDTVPFKLSVRDADAAIFVQSDPGSDASMHWMSDSSFLSTIYAPTGSNDLRVNHEGTGDVVAITNAGRVGVGTNSPDRPLHIRSTDGNGTVLLERGGGNTSIAMKSYSDSNFQTLTSDWNVRADPNGDFIIDSELVGGEPSLLIESDGRVGIGTSNPDYKLDVRGSVRVGDGTTNSQDIDFFSQDGDWQVGTNSPAGSTGADGNIFYIYDTSTASYALTVNKGNNHVGIGTLAPTAQLEVVGGDQSIGDPSIQLTGPGGALISARDSNGAFGGWDLYMTDSDFAVSRSGIDFPFVINAGTGDIGMGNSASSGFKLDVSGNIRCVNLTETSSKLHKDDVAPLGGALDSVLELQGVTYTWNDTSPEQVRGSQDIGFIAEDVNTVLPQIVAKDENGMPIGINYGKITPVLAEAIQELKAQHDSEVADLHADNDELRVRLERLELMLDAYARNAD